ncbi:MAG: NPCBM/NEW2 domain-containing protein, partial [Planctomycetaceae bacterium]|nr:NPCBM/NEW2 domain-containing protein [Planctomycetaceae bacterium]
MKTLKLYQVSLASLALIVGVLAFTVIAADVTDNSNVVYVEQLDLRNTTSGWQQTVAKKSVANNPIKLNGKTYEHGVGSHAAGHIAISLAGLNGVFTADVGIDDESDGQNAQMEFIVYGDEKILWKSGVVSTTDEPKKCEVKLNGIKTLRLVQTPGPNNNIDWDHGDWADAKITFENADKKLLANVKTINLKNAILDDNGSFISADDEINREWNVLKKELAKPLPDRVKNEVYRPESL